MSLRFLLAGKPKLAYRQWRMAQSLRKPTGPIKLHLGCGQKRLPGYVNIDCNLSAATDYVGDITALPCAPGCVERIEAYHVIEHIPRPLVKPTLAGWLALLQPGGVLVLECPDFRRDCEEYLAGNTERLGSVFGWQRFPGDAHHWGYTAESLSGLLQEVGFSSASSATPTDYHAEKEPCIRVEGIK